MPSLLPTRGVLHLGLQDTATSLMGDLRLQKSSYHNASIHVGLLSWTESTTSNFQSSKSKVPQVSPVIRPARDPEKQGTRAKLSGDLILCDQSTSKSPDILCVLIHDKS